MNTRYKEIYLISNENGDFFHKFGLFHKAKYVPREMSEYGLRFQTRESAESFIERKLNGKHYVISLMM